MTTTIGELAVRISAETTGAVVALDDLTWSLSGRSQFTPEERRIRAWRRREFLGVKFPYDEPDTYPRPALRASVEGSAVERFRRGLDSAAFAAAGAFSAFARMAADREERLALLEQLFGPVGARLVRQRVDELALTTARPWDWWFWPEIDRATREDELARRIVARSRAADHDALVVSGHRPRLPRPVLAGEEVARLRDRRPPARWRLRLSTWWYQIEGRLRGQGGRRWGKS